MSTRERRDTDAIEREGGLFVWVLWWRNFVLFLLSCDDPFLSLSVLVCHEERGWIMKRKQSNDIS